MNEDMKLLESRVILGKELNIYGTLAEPLFLAKDVAEWIGERDGYTVARKVEDNEKLIHKICVSGQTREMTFLTEYGLYEILMRSTKEKAKLFKSEVKKILKEIRTNGFYVNSNDIEEQMNILADALNEKMNKLHAESNMNISVQKSMVNAIECFGTYCYNISNNAKQTYQSTTFPILKLYSITELRDELYWEYHKVISNEDVLSRLAQLNYIKYDKQSNYIEVLDFNKVKTYIPYVSFSVDCYYDLIKYFSVNRPRVLIYG